MVKKDRGAVLLHFLLGFNKVGERDRKKILTAQGEFLEPLIGGQWNRKQKSVKPNFLIASRSKERQLLGEKKSNIKVLNRVMHSHGPYVSINPS